MAEKEKCHACQGGGWSWNGREVETPCRRCNGSGFEPSGHEGEANVR